MTSLIPDMVLYEPNWTLVLIHISYSFLHDACVVPSGHLLAKEEVELTDANSWGIWFAKQRLYWCIVFVLNYSPVRTYHLRLTWFGLVWFEVTNVDVGTWQVSTMATCVASQPPMNYQRCSCSHELSALFMLNSCFSKSSSSNSNRSKVAIHAQLCPSKSSSKVPNVFMVNPNSCTSPNVLTL